MRTPPARQPCELAVEEEADRGVPPVAVEDVARDHDEGGLELERLASRGPRRPRGWREQSARRHRRPSRRAQGEGAEMKVGRVDEFKRMTGMINPSALRTKSELKAIQRNLVGPGAALRRSRRRGIGAPAPGAPAGSGKVCAESEAQATPSRTRCASASGAPCTGCGGRRSGRRCGRYGPAARRGGGARDGGRPVSVDRGDRACGRSV